MNEYDYKGFKVFYKVEGSADGTELYKADAYVVCPEIKGEASLQQFHTEHPTKKGAKTEIKKILEDYINFEWGEFYAMKSRKF